MAPFGGRLPNGTIDLPAGNETILMGSALTFEGSGVDPDGDDGLITYAWGSPSSDRRVIN